MNPNEADRLRHMLDAAQAAIAFAAGKSRADLEADRMLQFALVRAVEVIGEAASGLPPEYKAGHTGIPWRAIVGMRNRLIHGYFQVDLNILWETVTRDIPALIPELQALTRSHQAPPP